MSKIPTQQMTPEQREMLKAWVRNSYDQITDFVLNYACDDPECSVCQIQKEVKGK